MSCNDDNRDNTQMLQSFYSSSSSSDEEYKYTDGNLNEDDIDE
jgi:hypothetical protein